MIVRKLVNKVTFQTDDTSLKNAESKTSKLKDKIKGFGMAMGASISAIGVLAVKSAADMEMMTTQFEVMLGSADKANEMMNQLRKFSAETPFALGDLAKGTQVLLSFGVAEEKVIDTMRMLGDTAGGNAEKLNGLILAYGKVQTKGKASMEEINMMAERGLPIIGVLTKQLGVTEKQFFKMVSAGKIGRDEVTKAFKTMTSEGGMFFRGMQKQAETAIGMWSTLKDNITLALAGIGAKVLPTLKGVMGQVTEMIQGSLGGVIESLVSGLMPLVKTIFSVLGGLMDTLLPIFNALFRFLSPIFGMLDAVIQLVMVFTKALSEELGTALEDLADMFVPLFKQISHTLQSLVPILSPILKILAKFIVLFLKMKFIVNILVGKLLLKAFTLLLRLLRPLLKLLSKFLVPVLEFILKIFEDIITFVEKAIGQLISGIIKVITFVFDIVNGVIEAINGIPFIKNKMEPLDSEAVVKMIQGEQKDINQKNTNINQQNNFNINGTNDPEAIKKGVGQAVGTPFQVRLKEIVEAT